MARNKQPKTPKQFTEPEGGDVAVMEAPKQQYFEGMEPPRIEELDKAAETYHAAKTQRMEFTEEEKLRKDILTHLMQQHDLKRYETPEGLVVTRITKSNVKTDRKP